MSRILTIGMAVHNNPQGVWMTIESIREKYPQCAQDVQFLVLDNCPDSIEGEATRDYVRNSLDRSGDGWVGHYITATPRQSTSLRNLIFDCAETEYVMCVDSHVFLKGPNALPKTVAFLKSGAAGNDLYHGPAYHERGYIYATHMNPAFRGQNFGTWGVMQAESGGHVFHADWPEPIEIPAHGMGLFLARRDTWLRFHHAFRHFGGEECYIHEKYRLHGRKCWCLPFLGWIHYYGNIREPTGGNRVTYPNRTESKLRNFLIGFREVGLDEAIPIEYYSQIIGQSQVAQVIKEVDALDIRPLPKPEGYQPFLGFPIRINDYSRNESQDYRQFETRLRVDAQ